jgi:hypothetical protein
MYRWMLWFGGVLPAAFGGGAPAELVEPTFFCEVAVLRTPRPLQRSGLSGARWNRCSRELLALCELLMMPYVAIIDGLAKRQGALVR